MGHLTGARLSALVDGQVSAGEAEQAWAHVYACHHCRDRVEREGWVKARLAGLSEEPDPTPDRLRGSLHRLTPSERFSADPHLGGREVAPTATGHRRTVALVSGGAAGAAMVGVLALGLGSASAPGPVDRRPGTGATQPVSTSTTSPLRAPLAVAATGSASTLPAGPVGSTSSTAPVPSPRGTATYRVPRVAP